MRSDSADREPESLRDLVMSTARGLRHRWFDALQPWQLSPHEVRALRVVARHENTEADEPPRLGDIARDLRIAPRSATEVIDRLEQRGFAHSAPDERDRRARCVCLTEEGRRVLADLREAQDADAADFFAVLTDVERTQLADVLRRLNTAHADDSISTGGDRRGTTSRSR
ncbi:MarR family winged helix-turn-helix transcriptional regulator [Gordonia aichiensis]|uniref:Putative MarR family transcriptional regulator n=1 Tax=Gordonia aichiensis NBRC 108223 TaxID=1220583 RepID=L7KN55_9ACTN|nr:MarR family transcriptional regulator [Gordonia aichiensis]GAC49392.1 putative MarR family transcriptional regulator [Gordonia aichiensis NBRC 108223]